MATAYSDIEPRHRPDRLALPVGPPLATGLVRAFAGILDHARTVAEGAASDPVVAVHEYRKALRRARAVLRLVKGFIGRSAYRQLSDTLRRLHRATSARRDRDVLIDTLARLDGVDTAPAVVSELGQAIARANGAASDIAVVLRQGAVELEPLPDALSHALPARVRWRDIASGLRKTYGRARRDMYRTFYSRDEDAIHDWRKRNKELTYQVELLTGLVVSGKLRKLRRRLSRMSDILGDIIDLLVLDDYIRHHASESEQKRLLTAIADSKRVTLETATERGSRLYERRPGAFARSVVRSVRTARSAARKAVERPR